MELKGYPIILISRAARPAGGFELFTQQRQRRNIQRQAAHHRHAFAASPLSFALHPQHAIGRRTSRSRRNPLVGRALALRHRLTTLGADAAGFGGVDQGGFSTVRI